MEKTLLDAADKIKRLKVENGREYTVANFQAVDERFSVDRRSECGRA